MSDFESLHRLITPLRYSDEQVWGISRLVAVALFIAPFGALGALGAVYLADESLYRTLLVEDGLVEWIQTLGFAIGSAFSAAIAVRLARRGHRPAAALYAVLMLSLFFIVGEEVAWAQRILHFTTPAGLAVINDKSEVSLHNITALAPWFNVVKATIGVYGTFGFLALAALPQRFDARVFDFFVIPSFLSSAFFFVLLQRFLAVTVLKGSLPANYGEFEELIAASALAVFTVLVWRRLKRDQPARMPSRTADP